MKKQNGITLIALIITIIVLLILAGVTIVALTGDNGILQKAGDAKTKSTDAEIAEQIKLAYLESEINRYTDQSDVVASTKAALKKIYGNNLDENSVKIENGKLKAKIYGIDYEYNTYTGVAGRTDDLPKESKITLDKTRITYDDFVQMNNGVFLCGLTAIVDESYQDSQLIWEMDSPDTSNLFFDQIAGNEARLEVKEKMKYGDITITVRIYGTNEVATCTLDTITGMHGGPD